MGSTQNLPHPRRRSRDAPALFPAKSLVKLGTNSKVPKVSQERPAEKRFRKDSEGPKEPQAHGIPSGMDKPDARRKM